ncbi:MAG: metalloregulator ArsR/SmtB family transcription factor [Chloroflexota bacterium]|nr:metalloregulator ArsR/SmtB family transcription factor [Chloroflexota bacterium]
MATVTLERVETRHDVPCCAPSAASPTVTEPEAEEYAAWFKALADPTRIRILNLLARSEEPLCVCDIVDHFPLGQPAISHHLKILRDVRFVHSERRGTFMYYRVNRACLAEFPEAARRLLNA